MIKYPHIISYVARTPWAIDSGKMSELLAVLAYRAAGHTFSSEEIQARIGAGPQPTTRRQQGSVAVIPIHGVLAHRIGGMEEMSGGASAEQIGRQVQAATEDEGVGTILYDIDSPGGTVPGIQELAAQMFALRGVKRQVAQVNSLAASAAYWLASQADEIVSLPSGMAGSIGVFSVVEDVSAALEKEGIKLEVMQAGKFKTEGAPWEPLSEEGRAHIQGLVDLAYTQFVADVARGRGVDPEAVRTGYGEGRVLEAKAAKKAGLIDRIGTMDETLRRLTGAKAAAAASRAEEILPALVAGETDRRRRLERF